MTTFRLLAATVGLTMLAIVIFILQNLTVVTIDFLFWSFEVRRAWLVFSLYASGLMSGIVIVYLLRLRKDI